MTAPVRPTIGAIGDAIVRRLSARVTTLNVAHFPDAGSRAPLLASPGYAFLFYKGAAFAPNEALGRASQLRTIEWWLLLNERALRGPGQATYERIEELESALIDDAWRPLPGCSTIELAGDEFVDEANGLWRWRIKFRHTLPKVGAQATPGGSPLTELVLEGTGS